MTQFAIATLGCKVNQYESNAIRGELEDIGYEYVSFSEKADIYIINTCTVTEMAEKKSRQMARRAKVINSKALVIVTGCLAQSSPEEVKEKTGADLVLGNSEKGDIVTYIKNKQNHVDDIMKVKLYDNMHITKSDERTRAYVKIQDGCVNFCTYCIIPYVRGPIRSRQLHDIVDEIKELVIHDVKEVVLTGIHLDSYGKDLGDISLMDVIETINNIKGIKRIRLGSLEPTVITDEFVKRALKCDKLCYHFHLSLQSGCDKTLKDMNRKYTTTQFKSAAKLIYEQFNDSSITSDIIVGFPGETEEDFKKTYDFVNSINFLKVHVFKFSKRKGTKAYDMDCQISKKIKDERSKKMIALTDRLSEAYMKKYVGKVVTVLTENYEEKFIKGHTKNFIPVLIKQAGLNVNHEYMVTVTGYNHLHLEGKI